MIARQAGLVTLNNVLGALQGFVALFVIARYMGDEVLGQRAFALALVALAGMATRLGLPLTHVRHLASGEDPGAANFAFLRVKLLLTGAFALAAAAAWYLWFDVLGKGTTDTTPAALQVAFWLVVLQSLRDLPVATFQGLRRIVEREAVLFTNTILAVLLTVLVGVAFAASNGRWTPWPEGGEAVARLLGATSPMGAEHALTLLMMALLTAEAAALVLAVALAAVARIPLHRSPRGLARSYLRWTLPILVLTLGEAAARSLSQVMLGFWWDDAELGQFAAALKLSEGFLLLGASISIVLLPAIAAGHARGAEADARQLVREAERWTSLLLWPCMVVVAVAHASIIHILLSDQFTRAGTVLIALCAQAMVLSLTLPVQQLAIGTTRSGHAARVILVSLLVTAGLGLLLIPPGIGGVQLAGLGANGAALASMAGALCALLLYRAPLGSWHGHRFWQPAILKHILAAATTYALYTALPLAPPGRFWTLAAHAAAIVATYATLLVLLRELRRSDLGLLRALVTQSPKKP